MAHPDKEKPVSSKFKVDPAPRAATPASAKETAATKTRGVAKPTARESRPESMPPGKRTQSK